MHRNGETSSLCTSDDGSSTTSSSCCCHHVEKPSSSSSSRYDFIFFDWSGTLALKEPLSGREDKLARRLGSLYDKLQILIGKYPALTLPSCEDFHQKLFAARGELTSEKGCGCYNWADLMNRVWTKVGLESIGECDKAALLAAFFAADENHMYPGTLKLLTELHKRKVPLGLIRNSKTPAAAMRRRLAKYGINDFFTVVVMAGDEGAQKPDKEVFLNAVKAANLQAVQENNPSRILYVGNETALDVEGANGVGWTSVLVRHTETTSNGLAQHEIDDLWQLLDIVQS